MGGLIDFLELFRLGETFKMQQKKQEIIPLLERLMKLQKRTWCLEIGSYDGGTARILSKLFDNVISIDISPQYDSWMNLKKVAHNWIGIVGDSKAETTVNMLKNMKFDFIFIDGDHSYEGAMQDFVTYREFLDEYGIIALHDIMETKFHQENNCEVHKLWQDLRHVYYNEELCYTGSDDTGQFSRHLNAADWGGIGVVYDASPLVTPDIEELIKTRMLD